MRKDENLRCEATVSLHGTAGLRISFCYLDKKNEPREVVSRPGACAVFKIPRLHCLRCKVSIACDRVKVERFALGVATLKSVTHRGKVPGKNRGRMHPPAVPEHKHAPRIEPRSIRDKRQRGYGRQLPQSTAQKSGQCPPILTTRSMGYIGVAVAVGAANVV